MKSIPSGLCIALILLCIAAFPLRGHTEGSSSYNSGESSGKYSDDSAAKSSASDSGSTGTAGQAMVCVSLAELTASDSEGTSDETSSKDSR